MSVKYDVIIIGAGIGGLTAGAILARNGKKVLILEKNHVVGGYAVCFKRKGFTFDASLHLINGGKHGPLLDVLNKCGIDSKIEFLKPAFLYRSIFPDLDIKIPQCSLSELIERLNSYFPEEKEKTGKLIKSIASVALEVKQLRATTMYGPEAINSPSRYDASAYYLYKSWGDIIDQFLDNKALKVILSQIWPFFGVAPKTLSAYYFSASLFDYIVNGGYYLKGGSDSLGSALSEAIRVNNGKILLNVEADEIILRGGRAVGVKITSGEVFSCVNVISNIDVITTFSRLLSKENLSSEFLADIGKMKHSISGFEVHLGLKTDLSQNNSFGTEYELFLNPDYDCSKQYAACENNIMEDVPMSVTFYSNIENDSAPQNKSYVSITTLAGYDYWKQCPIERYKKQKELLADILIRRAQKIIPGLSGYIEVKDIATPLTMERYTGNYKGAIYGWEQNVEQSGTNRTNNFTPIDNVYLVGAWTRPGAGITGVMQSGERVSEHIVKRNTQ